MHTFSMTCKAESVLDLFHDKKELDKAIKWFKEHSISKIYIESYRHGRFVSEERLLEVRDSFLQAGLEVAACITPTCLDKRGENQQSTNFSDVTSCFTNLGAQEYLQEIVERTARVFDLIIFDDFLFASCNCDLCEDVRGARDLGEFRADLMISIAKERILAPARSVNENVKIIIKYPLWHESYAIRGYDIIRETELFDYTWIGTETRNPDSKEAGRRPQTSASWIQNWMNDVSDGKCGGGWYDPIDTSPEIFLEQARQTIIGGAQESLLHCYDYLGTKTPGIAIHGKDLKIKDGFQDAEAFKNEAKSLEFLADMLSDMQAYGVLTPKKPNHDYRESNDAYLQSYIGMLGIPVLGTASLKPADAVLLAIQTQNFKDLTRYIENACEEEKSILITKELLDALKNAGKKLPKVLENLQMPSNENVDIFNVDDTFTILRSSSDPWDLIDLEQGKLDLLRNKLLKPFGLEFFSPSRVSLHLFHNKHSRCEVIENFNDCSVKVVLNFKEKMASERELRLALPKQDSVILNQNANSLTIEMSPHSMLAISTKERR